MTGNLFLKNDARMHFAIANEDGNARMWLYKDKGGDGVRLNNGIDGGGEFAFGKNGEFYSPSHIHSGNAFFASDGNAYGTCWGGYLSNWANTQFAVRDNNINARATIDWVRGSFLSGFRLGAVESAQVWRAYGYNDQPPYVITGVINGNTDDLIDNLTRRPLQMYINGWRNIDWL
ncbi:hypothetical protein ACEZ7K_004940 [Salmonella enterica]